MREKKKPKKSKPDPFVKFEEIILKRIKLQTSIMIDGRDFLLENNVGYRSYEDHVVGTLIHNLTLQLASHQLKHEEITYPADWVQAFKERWFPKWLLKKFPVKYTTIVFDVKELYDKIALPSKDPFIYFNTYPKEKWSPDEE